jgi:hypothetical protein
MTQKTTLQDLHTAVQEAINNFGNDAYCTAWILLPSDVDRVAGHTVSSEIKEEALGILTGMTDHRKIVMEQVESQLQQIVEELEGKVEKKEEEVPFLEDLLYKIDSSKSLVGQCDYERSLARENLSDDEICLLKDKDLVIRRKFLNFAAFMGLANEIDRINEEIKLRLKNK